MRLMADSDEPLDIPAGKYPIVASYVGVGYGWSSAARAKHRASLQVDICVENIVTNAHVADVESGGLTPDQGAEYAVRKVAAGGHPVIYFSASRWDEIHAAMDRRGLAPGSFGVWVALWNQLQDLDPNWIAHQFADDAMIGQHWDLSTVRDYWPGLDPLPRPPAPEGGGASISNWTGLQDLVGTRIPQFAGELRVLSSGIDGIG